MRLITRANMDGLACGVLITTMEHIEQVVFTNPANIEDGTFYVKPGDAIANLPYHHKASFWFDHHEQSLARMEELSAVPGKRGAAPSTARLIYEYYNSPLLERFDEFLAETDRIDSAQLTMDEVLQPKGWVLLSCTLDPFNNLPTFHDYVNGLILSVKAGNSIEQIMEVTDVKSRINRYLLDAEDFQDELRRVSRVEENVIVTDFRQVELMPIGNRFLAFAMFPEGNVQVRIYPTDEDGGIRLRLGKSPFNRTCGATLGKLAEEYGGGGLDGAAGLTLKPDRAEETIREIIAKLKGA